MAGKLYPPYIDGKVPAFCGTELVVPFRHNRAVSQLQIQSMCCKIKTVSTNEWVWTIQIPEGENNYILHDEKTRQYSVVFNLETLWRERKDPNVTTNDGYKPYYQWLIEGLYYKIQLAYIDNSGQVGYFSDVGVTKYTSKPTVTIDGLNSYGVNNSLYDYVGVYSQFGGDTAERAYSYNFTIYDQADNIFITSGEQIHNSSLDTEIYESKDEFYCNKELKANEIYKLKYTVTTINGLVAASQSYLIMKKDTVRPSINATLHAEVDYNDGFIALSLIPNDDDFYSGNFAIARSSSKDNFSTWDEICKFSLNRESPLRNLFKDFTVEQGIQYCYSLQQYNTRGLYSNRMLSETLYADFEDMFLYDGERQLKIRFNPTVSSFKTDILESKQDTLGGRYPFIFRNGNVNYKEFPISGLISYLMDDQAYFIKKEDLGALERETTDLVSDNIRAERMFKLEVMDWLNDGNPKLFRSPTEGNYVVRLLNISLSPNTTVGRMLHTFSANAYEVADTSFTSLEEFGLFTAPNLETMIMRFKTIDLSNVSMPTWVWNEESPSDTYISNPPSITEIDANGANALDDLPIGYLGVFDGVAPDTIFGLRFENTSGENAIEYIRIGETQIYQINAGDNRLAAIYPIWTPNIAKSTSAERKFDGTFTLGYYTTATTDNFAQISNFEVEDRMTQFFDLHNNIIEELEDIRTSIGKLYWLKFQTRDIKEIYIDRETNKIYSDGYNQVSIMLNEILPTSVYADVGISPVRYYSGKDILDRNSDYLMGGDLSVKFAKMPVEMVDNDSFYWTDETLDTWGDSDIPVNRLYKFSINHVDNNIDLETIGRYIITNLDNVTSISLGRMIMVDCYYQLVSKSYSIEDEDPDLEEVKRAWITQNELFFDAVRSEEIAESTKVTETGSFGEQYIRDQYAIVQVTYTDYITALRTKLTLAEQGG